MRAKQYVTTYSTNIGNEFHLWLIATASIILFLPIFLYCTTVKISLREADDHSIGQKIACLHTT
jgi:hypothetical protein